MITNNFDSFISDDDSGEEDLCPLCVEEMDLSDKNFKPCPCGYQICQFCYNNIRQNPDLNGRCPACRRQYDDESVEYKQLTAEEWKLEQSKQSKREKERKQKEKEKKENEQLNRKHLAGMRVIQKNLVYIVGLNPPVPPEELHSVLRSEKYFGQFGKILKIVVNKRNPATGHFVSGVGVYVTFSKKEEAAKCIAAVDGSYMDGKQLKAAFGTTKYCSSYLRGQPCPNPNCMFLHEPGEEADSYTRQDLSTRQSLKMGGIEGYKHQAPFPRHHSSHYSTDDSHSSSAAPSPAPSNNTPLATSATLATPGVGSHPMPGAAPLPPTASWASKSNNNISAMVEEPEILADASAFPSLAEFSTLHQQHQTQPQTQQPHQKKNKHGHQHNDEFNPEETAVTFIDGLLNELKSFTNTNFDVKSDALTTGVVSCPPLFAYNSSKSSKTQDRDFNRKLIQMLIVKSAKPLIVQPPVPMQAAPPAQPVTQAHTPAQTQAQLNEYIQQQQQHQQHQQQQRVNSQGQVPQQFFTQQTQPQQQQPNAVAQALLQQQLLHQQAAAAAAAQRHTPSQQHPQPHQLHERQYAGTPPPPGMFPPQNGDQSVNGPASELLSHLLNGKKISA